MGFEDFVKEFDWSKLAFFALFGLPGFISLQVWSLIVPTNNRPLKEAIPEAIGFGVLNAFVAGPLLLALLPLQAWALYGFFVGTLVVLPGLWPFGLKWDWKGSKPTM